MRAGHRLGNPERVPEPSRDGLGRAKPDLPQRDLVARANRPLALARALALALLAGCCADPWVAFPESTPPDRQCSTGDVHGDDVYIWNCLRGREHVVVSQESGEYMCRAPVRATAPCGQPTALEAHLALTPAMCAGPRGTRAWRTR